MSLIQLIKEKMPKEKDINCDNKPGTHYECMCPEYNSYNQALQDCISSLPEVMKTVRDEIVQEYGKWWSEPGDTSRNEIDNLIIRIETLLTEDNEKK